MQSLCMRLHKKKERKKRLPLKSKQAADRWIKKCIADKIHKLIIS